MSDDTSTPCQCIAKLDNHEQVDVETGQYYLFDWDNNIIDMPTKVCFEKQNEKEEWIPHQLSSEEYAKNRGDKQWRPPGGDWSKAFIEFGDFGPRGSDAFLEDLKIALKALENGAKPPPSYPKFKKALTEGRLFAIVTARGHASSTIRRGVEHFVQHALTEEERQRMLRNLRKFNCHFDGKCNNETPTEKVFQDYFDLCRFNGVTNPDFAKKFNLENLSGAAAPEEGKKAAIHEFVHHVVALLHQSGKAENVSIAVGFSDDDKKNVAVVHQFLEQELAEEFKHVKFVLYDTSEASVGSKKILVSPGASPAKKKRKTD